MLTALGRAPLEIPEPGKPPPSPYGAQYPIAADYRAIPKPTSSAVEPGTTCERVSDMDVPSIISPPPPTQVVLSLVNPNRGAPPPTIRLDVRAHVGTAEVSVPDCLRKAYVLRAASESIDGVRSRTVAMLIRRP